MKKPKPIYYIYSIKLGGLTRYIGMTNNIKRRQSQHRTDSKKLDLTKSFYKMKRQLHLEEEIVLEVIYQTEKKIEAIRMEAYLILKDHFADAQLWQSPPQIIKYF